MHHARSEWQLSLDLACRAASVAEEAALRDQHAEALIATAAVILPLESSQKLMQNSRRIIRAGRRNLLNSRYFSGRRILGRKRLIPFRQHILPRGCVYLLSAHEHLLGTRCELERITAPDHDVSFGARLQ